LAVRLGWIGRRTEFERLARNRFEGLCLDGTRPAVAGGTEKILLLKPMTFMNLSGKSVQAAMAFYQAQPADLMVVLDDLALPAGKLRIRKGGSSGGHNGLRDIERALGTTEYPRMRIGIDPAPQPIPGRDYVLGRFTPEQRRAIDPALSRVADALIAWIDKGIDAAMNAFNGEDAI
jgi:PTH1 family peptidyl-tRNA hydrolase